MLWDRSGLETDGFSGLVPFSLLPNVGVLLGAGVYVVYRDSDAPPDFRERSRAGRFKGKDPSVSLAALVAAWVPGSWILYVGNAALGSSGDRGCRGASTSTAALASAIP